MTFRSLDRIIWNFLEFRVYLACNQELLTHSQSGRERERMNTPYSYDIALCSEWHVRLIKTRNSCSFKFNFMSQKVSASLCCISFEFHYIFSYGWSAPKMKWMQNVFRSPITMKRSKRHKRTGDTQKPEPFSSNTACHWIAILSSLLCLRTHIIRFVCLLHSHWAA